MNHAMGVPKPQDHGYTTQELHPTLQCLLRLASPTKGHHHHHQQQQQHNSCSHGLPLLPPRPHEIYDIQKRVLDQIQYLHFEWGVPPDIGVRSLIENRILRQAFNDSCHQDVLRSLLLGMAVTGLLLKTKQGEAARFEVDVELESKLHFDHAIFQYNLPCCIL
mmetsp:Transcript_13706/g.38582  ORF Transcript_13706/g.38582 Transcript_13706/m.38582 type:complete len:163 (-) Transcript_13706:430-918(-)